MSLFAKSKLKGVLFMERMMAIDYGDSRVGIAVSDLLGITAQGVETIQNTGRKALFSRLEELIREYKPSVIVIGLPKNMNGTLGERAQKSIEFEQRLKEIYDGKTVLFDERLTTVSAIRTLNETNTRGKKRKNVVDTVAATLILQSYMSRGN